MEGASRLGRRGGLALAVGGVGFFAAGALHPQGDQSGSFRETIASMLQDPTWALAHSVALVSALVLAYGVWLLARSGRTDGRVGRTGGRLAIAGLTLMAVEFVVEIAAVSQVEAYAAGDPAFLVELTEPMQAIGWPALGVGFAMLALGSPALAPRWVAVLGSLGALAIGVAGILVEGFHVLEVAPLFAGGNVLAIWMIVAGVRLARGREIDVRASAPTPSVEGPATLRRRFP